MSNNVVGRLVPLATAESAKAEHLSPLFEGIFTARAFVVRVRVTKDGETWFLTMRHNGEPINWSPELETLCDQRMPTFANLINAGFTISQGAERG